MITPIILGILNPFEGLGDILLHAFYNILFMIFMFLPLKILDFLYQIQQFILGEAFIKLITDNFSISPSSPQGKLMATLIAVSMLTIIITIITLGIKLINTSGSEGDSIFYSGVKNLIKYVLLIFTIPLMFLTATHLVFELQSIFFAKSGLTIAQLVYRLGYQKNIPDTVDISVPPN
jgi:hypothetical protein